MDSSSESFLWSDTSNDCSDNNFGSGQTMGAPCGDEAVPDVNYKEEACDSILRNEHESNENKTQKRQKKSKKRKFSETKQESSDFSHPGSEEIKLEPESDIDAGSKKKSNKTNNMCVNDSQDSIVYHEDYLDLRVKQEQFSGVTSEVDKPKKKKKHRSVSYYDKNTELGSLEFSKSEPEHYLDLCVKEEQTFSVKSKKKKKRTLNSLIDNGGECSSDLEKSGESYFDIGVKQEQATLVEPVVEKSKKNKKCSSVISSEMDTPNAIKSIMVLDNNADIVNSADRADEQEYSVIEEKFSAEETVIEKPRKKKHRKEVEVRNNNNVNNDNNETGCFIIENNIGVEETVIEKSRKKKHKREVVVNENNIFDNNNMNNDNSAAKIAEEHRENMNETDISLQPSDFTCNNIASSTVLNNSAVDVTTHEQINETEGVVRASQKVSKKHISDRIRFEDDSSVQESVANTLSDKINRFLIANPQLDVYNPESQKPSLITKDDEIWALRWPHKINIENLKNATLSLEGKYKVKMEGHTYEGVPSEVVNRITLFVNHDGQTLLTNLAVNECINYHKRIPKPHIPDGNIMVNNQTNFIPLPETKCRHPLFGPHYKKSIKIPSAVAEHLNAAKQRSREIICETTKKKKQKKDKHTDMDIKMEEDCKPEPLKKKKKRRHSEEEQTLHKPKRIKLESDSPALWESEQAIEENLFNF